MSTIYKLPSAARLEFSRGAVTHAYADPGITQQLEAEWARSYLFWDVGHLDGLFIAFGSMNGQLSVTDMMFAHDYAHEDLVITAGDTARPTGYTGQMWLPNDLTPVSGTDLDSVNINIYFHADGAEGSAMATLPCVARPEQVRPLPFQQGLIATSVIWRWEIVDDTQPTIV